MTLLVLSVTAHLLAAIIWLGTLFTWFLLYTPILRNVGLDESHEFLLRKRVKLIQYSCFGVLLLSGLFLMTQDDNYIDWLSITNRWSLLLLVKHIGIAMMILLMVLLGGLVEPLARKQGLAAHDVAFKRIKLWQKRIYTLQVLLGSLIVLLSAGLVVQ